MSGKAILRDAGISHVPTSTTYIESEQTRLWDLTECKILKTNNVIRASFSLVSIKPWGVILPPLDLLYIEIWYAFVS